MPLNNDETEIAEGEKKQIVDVISAQAVLKGLSEQRAFFQSLDDCNDQDLNALRWLESRALKQVEKSTAQKQLSNCINVIVTITDCDLHNK